MAKSAKADLITTSKRSPLRIRQPHHLFGSHQIRFARAHMEMKQNQFWIFLATQKIRLSTSFKPRLTI